RRGRLEVNVEPEEGQTINFQIETPTAVIQVTGTRFVVTVSADGTTGVEVQEGTVRVTSETVMTQVSAGEAVTVRPGAPPATVTPTYPPPASTDTPTALPILPAPPTRRPSEPTIRPPAPTPTAPTILGTPVISPP